MRFGWQYTSVRRVIVSCTIYLIACRESYPLPALLLGIMAIWSISKVSELAASGRWRTAVLVAIYATLSASTTQSLYLGK